MGRILQVLSIVQLVVAVVLVAVTADDILKRDPPVEWPNLRCHPGGEDSRDSYDRSGYKHFWQACGGDEKRTGVCRKVCMLRSSKMMYQNDEKDDPVIFDLDRIMGYVGRYLGSSRSSTPALVKMEMDLKNCEKNHPEYKGLKNLRKATCGPWNNILSCLDSAFGCSGNKTGN